MFAHLHGLATVIPAGIIVVVPGRRTQLCYATVPLGRAGGKRRNAASSAAALGIPVSPRPNEPRWLWVCPLRLLLLRSGVKQSC